MINNLTQLLLSAHRNNETTMDDTTQPETTVGNVSTSSIFSSKLTGTPVEESYMS